MKFSFSAYILFICLFFTAVVVAQISPGEMTKAHAELDGVNHCTQCHTVGKTVSPEKCLACHQPIKANMHAKKGYHGSAEVLSKSCVTCHNEHHGRNFKIVVFDKTSFDHKSAGWELKGKHATITCQDCHKPANIANAEIKKKIGTYLGLSTNCLSCHTDYHQGKMSANCAECHSFESFKNAKAFDHNKTKFPLVGRHSEQQCVACHPIETVNGKPAQKFSGLVYNNCTGCHKDVHNNKFGQDCKKCHSEETFHNIKTSGNFNHDNTNFKLLGKHKAVDCKACHKTNITNPLKHSRCSDCHKDYHQNEFSRKGVSPDCNTCHNNDSFTETTYTLELHSKTKFPLEGAHQATACVECHKKTERWTFSKMGTNCIDCHKDEHKGKIDEKYYSGAKCTECHDVNGWKSVKFDHNKTGFELQGVHSKTECSSCHYPINEFGKRVQNFNTLKSDCSACHSDSHNGQFEKNGKTDCKACHGFDNWTTSKFDHNTSRFKLEGAHLKLECSACHKLVKNEKESYIQYKFKNIECSNCHQ